MGNSTSDTLTPGKSRFQTASTQYYEASSTQYGGKVIVQAPLSSYPSIDELVNLKNDYEFSHTLDLDCVLKSLDLVRTPQGLLVIKENFDGISLQQYIDARDITIPIFLQIAIRLATLLRDIHAHHIVLKDLSPENILISPETLKLKVCSLCAASPLQREQLEIQVNESFQGSLWYISPEQTGRVGRSIDYRTDFYSLGIIYYQILCGRLPFNYKDPMELVYAHIAKHPIEPSKLKENIPLPLSNLVMKLMAKNAEDRYRSAEGIIWDLQECLQQWQHAGTIAELVLGQHDFSSVFTLSEKLYGRDAEIKALQQAFEQVQNGPAQLVLIAGYSGVGKTRLINEIHKSVVKQNGFFATGKFDQFKRDTPLSAFSMAFNSLIRQLLSEDQNQIEYWKQQLLKAIGGNGQVLIEIIPALDLLIGKQEPVLKLGTSENKNRLLTAFTAFLGVLDQESRPLALFIDDLQWVDSGSLELLQALLLSPLQNILIIGAYRNNEVNRSHPLQMMTERLSKEAPHKISTITLQELPTSEVNQLVADSLLRNPAETGQLSELISAKTQGNPFFIKQFLLQLAQVELIYFTEPTHVWQWNLTKINELDVTENVVDLVVSKIQKLTLPAQRLLSLAACIGNRFDIETLAIICQQPENTVAEILWETVTEGFVSAVGKPLRYYKDLLWDEMGLKKNTTDYHHFRFQHDRIQQAAYSLIPEQEKKYTHLNIGRLLLDKISPEEQEDHLFDILNHLNFASELISDAAEREQLVRLNLRAGIKAKNANAIQPALRYYKTGMDIGQQQANSELYKDLLIGCSECAYLSGNFNESEQLFDRALSNEQNQLEKADILSRKMLLYENTQRHHKAIETAKQALKLLGTNLSINPTSVQVMVELLKVKFLLRQKSVDLLLQNKKMESPRIILTMKILMNLWGPVYLLQKQNLLALKILKMVNLSIRYGNSIESALAYAFYGYVISAQLKDYRNGYDFARLGMALNEKLGDKSLRAKVLVIAEGCVAHRQVPFGQVLDNLRNAYHVGVETNDIIYAGYAVSFINRSQLFMGENLQRVADNMKGYIHFTRQIQSLISLHQLLTWARLVTNLTGLPPDPEVYGELQDEESQLAFIQDFAVRDNVLLPLANYYISAMATRYILNETEEALVLGEKAKPLLQAVLGLAESGEFYFYYPLCLIAAGKRRQHLAFRQRQELNRHIKMLQGLANGSPANYQAKYLLVLAEQEILHRRYEAACKLFDEALESARNNKLTYVAAIIYERKAEMSFACYDTANGNKWLHSALLEYQEWGAAAKVTQLQEENPIFASLIPHKATDEKLPFKSLTSTKLSSETIDQDSILKAATSISGEVISERLLEKLLRIIIENAGAHAGYIIMVRNQQLWVDARSTQENEFAILLDKEPLEKVPGLSHSIVRMVYNTAEPVILDDALNNPVFSVELLAGKSQVKSVLCMPIIRNNTCVALLYLENHLSTHAFTAKRINVLNLLSGQIAISLENAQLYQNLEQKVQERTFTIESQKLEIEREKRKSDDLLLNILPLEIAEELKQHGHYKPRRHDSVTIIFTDFEQFTLLSQKITAEELVEMIDLCYKKFDEITARYQVEKIKTIGDSYMCVSGLPVGNPHHAVNAVRAALEMVDFVAQFMGARQRQGLPYCAIRVGLHTGPVIAGVVGHHKFAYDIWGDSVNTACRMQTAGEPGRINISDSTFTLVQDYFRCEQRGRIEVKHKGKIEMYFVNAEISPKHINPESNDY